MDLYNAKYFCCSNDVYMKLIKELNQRKSIEFVNINTDYSFVKLISLIYIEARAQNDTIHYKSSVCLLIAALWCI